MEGPLKTLTLMQGNTWSYIHGTVTAKI